MSNRLPTPIIHAQDKLEKIEFDPELNKYWLTTPTISNDRIEVCGYLNEDGTRCREPISSGKCKHLSLNRELVSVESSDVLDILNAVLEQSSDEDQKASLQQCIQLAKCISQEQLQSLDQEIRMAYALMYYHIRICGSALSVKDMVFVLGILRDIVRAKEVQSRVDKTTKLDDTAVTEFVLEIFSVLKTELKKDTYSKVIQAIYDRVILPRQAAKIIGQKVTVITDAEVLNAAE